jgi:DNA-binding NarL/FixJ family response regulator
VTVPTTRVALADDDILLREGLASLLEHSGFDVVAQCGDAMQLVALVRELRPDLVVVDIRMPPRHATDGLDAARVIREEFPQTAVLVLSAHVEVEHAMDLLASGQRSGYLLKDRITDVPEFIETLKRIVRGGSVVDPALVHELVAARRADDPLRDLTTREREVLALMAEGRSNAGIARHLWVAEGTVEKHVRSIMMKLRLAETTDDHRRVLAVLTFLDARLVAFSGTAQQGADGRCRQLPFRQEPDGRAHVDQVGEVIGRMRRDDDHLGVPGPRLRGQPPGQIEAALRTEYHVHQGHIRLGHGGLADSFGGIRHRPDDGDPTVLQDLPGRLQEPRIVVDDEAA